MEIGVPLMTMNNLSLRMAFGALAAASLVSAEVTVVEQIIVKVNGDVILRSDFDRVRDEIRAELEREDRLSEAEKRQHIEDREKNILRDLIDERLLVQHGKDMGVNVEAQVLRQRDEIMKQFNLKTVDEFEEWATERTGMAVEDLLDRMRDQFVSQAVLGQEVGSRIVVTRSEVENYYQEHKDEFVRSEGVRLAEILISSEGQPGGDMAAVEKKAREVHERVRRGEPFAEMARRFSDSEASKEAGGDIGIFRRGVLQKEIEDQVFDANPGYVSDLIPIQRGFLILKVTDRYREGLAELEEVEGEIRDRLMGPQYGPAVREFLTELREYGYIEIQPGYVDSAPAPGKSTAWTDPAALAPVTTTRDEVLERGKKKKLLWLIPLGGGKDKGEPADAVSEQGST